MVAPGASPVRFAGHIRWSPRVTAGGRAGARGQLVVGGTGTSRPAGARGRPATHTRKPARCRGPLMSALTQVRGHVSDGRGRRCRLLIALAGTPRRASPSVAATLVADTNRLSGPSGVSLPVHLQFRGFSHSSGSGMDSYMAPNRNLRYPYSNHHLAICTANCRPSHWQPPTSAIATAKVVCR